MKVRIPNLMFFHAADEKDQLESEWEKFETISIKYSRPHRSLGKLHQRGHRSKRTMDHYDEEAE